MKGAKIVYIPSSHLDLYWLGNYKTCLERGAEVIRGYLDRCLATPDETFLLETVVFAEYFLEKHPEYRPAVLRLLAEGRLEVGSAYVDRWETLVGGEALIRNVLLGKRWCRSALGIENELVTHPDLPSLSAQIPQIYSQLGIRYYVTSRKVHRHGRVWRYRAPDGSRLLMLNWPRHYVFPLINATDAPPEVLKSIWVPPLDLEQTLQGFPLGTVAASGSAGDLAGRETFRERYGQDLEDYVADFRARYPALEFGYAIPSAILSAYQEYPDLWEGAGEVPSVWGVAGDEDVEFYPRDRRLSARLLAAESLAAVLRRLGLPWRPPAADGWQGIFYEPAFFARKDPIPPGRELETLWRMHIFCQDHNGGGQEGALSMFQKRVLQERALSYCQEILDFGLGQVAARLPGSGPRLLVFNPHGQPWSGALSLRLAAGELPAGSAWLDGAGHALPAQLSPLADGQLELNLALNDVPACGYQAYTLGSDAAEEPSSVRVTQGVESLRLESPALAVEIDLRSGALIHLVDLQRGLDWGGERLGQVYSIAESGNDVSLRILPDAEVSASTLLGVVLLETGPLFTRARIRRRLLRCEVEQTLTLWGCEARLDLETRIYWWGKHNQQVRLVLSTPLDRAGLAYGAPFYGAGWTETLEGCGPWNSDEISPADQASYREVHDWVHLQNERGGLTLCSNHPGYHHDPQGALEAVLLRSVPSCGDGRLYFEHAGEHAFTFHFIPGAPGWQAAGSPQVAARLLRPPVAVLSAAGGEGALPIAHSLLQVEDRRFALSCLYPALEGDAVIARVWDTSGEGGAAYLSGPLAAGQASEVNFLEEAQAPLQGRPWGWMLQVPPHAIRTVRFEK